MKGGSNNGVIIQQYAGADGLAFDSREAGATAPTLKITYCLGALPTFTVTFDANGGSGSTGPADRRFPDRADAQRLHAGRATRSAVEHADQRIGHAVCGRRGRTPSTANVTLYAQWTADNQTLTFNSNGGSPVTAITQAFGTTVNAPTDPTKTGYTFAGWYNEVGLTTPYTFPHTMGLSTTIYAKWTADNQTLTFNSNGGSPVTAITQAFGTTVNAPTDPTKTGYTFAGWYNEVGLTTPYTFPHTMGLSTTIYAKWTADNQTLTFNSNGGSPVTSHHPGLWHYGECSD